MMDQRTQYTTQTGTIEPGGTVQIIRQAQFVACLESSSAFRIGFDSGPLSDFEAGLTLNTVVGFQRLSIVNPSATDALTYRVALGQGDVKDARLSLTGTVNTNVIRAAGLTAYANLSCPAGSTLLLPDDQDRGEAVFTNLGADRIWIAGQTVPTGVGGIPLAPGQAISVDGRAPVYAWNEFAGAIDVARAAVLF